MKSVNLVLLLLTTLCPACWAGEIYGNLSDGQRPIQGARVEVQSPGRPASTSDANGAYNVFLPEQGRFLLKVSYGGQSPAITVFSYQRSVRYDLILEKKGGTFSLRRK